MGPDTSLTQSFLECRKFQCYHPVTFDNRPETMDSHPKSVTQSMAAVDSGYGKIRKRTRQKPNRQTALLAENSRSGHPGRHRPVCQYRGVCSEPGTSFPVFATPRETRKYVNLCAEKRVALLIDNSRNREDDFHQAMAVTATGRVCELSGSERVRAAKEYLLRHPSLESFVHAETSALMQVTTETYYLVENFQKVTKLCMQP